MILRTLEEHLKYGNLSDELVRMIDAELVKFAKQDEEIKSLRKENELAWEQVSFARDNFETLEHSLNSVTSAKQAREAFARVMDNGYFEM